jgi:NSS family neurotransmitter:Na+ symporter
MTTESSMHGEWSSRWMYFLAATGSAVGLGNIWKFPYIAGENGGGAFVLVYLFTIVLVGVPALIAEVMMGRRGKRDPVSTMLDLSTEAGSSSKWKYLGWLAVLGGLLILSFYTVIAGWALRYLWVGLNGELIGLDNISSIAYFDEFTSSATELTGWSTLFLILTMSCIALGVNKGIEASLRFVMPLMLVSLLVMVGFAMQTGSFEHAVRFLFEPDLSKLTGDVVLVAMGHAFFTLAVGAGSMMIYGAYVPADISLPRVCFDVALADTAIALLAGLAIFPFIFANDLSVSGGPGLIFMSLPIAFGQMPYGTLMGTVFFLMLSLAAFSSAISMIEGMVTVFMERWNLSRVKAANILGLVVWVLSIGTVLSFNIGKDWTLFGKTFFDLVDYLTANIMLPLVSLMTTVFVGWVMDKTIVEESVLANTPRQHKTWYLTLKYMSPLAISLVFLAALNVV